MHFDAPLNSDSLSSAVMTIDGVKKKHADGPILVAIASNQNRIACPS